MIRIDEHSDLRMSDLTDRELFNYSKISNKKSANKQLKKKKNKAEEEKMDFFNQMDDLLNYHEQYIKKK